MAGGQDNDTGDRAIWGSKAPVAVLRDPARPGAALRGRTVLLPGELAPVLALDLPARLTGPARLSVARRQVTDLTGISPDVLDLRPLPEAGAGARAGRGRSRTWHRVMVTDTAALAPWRAAAGAARARGLLPDYLALPAAPG